MMAVLMLTAMVGTGWAQAAYFDADAVTRDCQRGQCKVALENVLANLAARSLPAEEMNSQIALLAAVLIELAKAGGSAISADTADALVMLASYSTDPGQQAALQQVALAVSRGEVGLFDTATPYAVSPT